MIKRTLFVSLLFLSLTGCSTTQTAEKPILLPPADTEDMSVVDGKFRSRSGNFTISIAEMPSETIDLTRETDRVQGVRQILGWYSPNVRYTIHFLPSVDSTGNPLPYAMQDMIASMHSSVLRSNGQIVSEKPFTLGDVTGTEIRYRSEGRDFISRLFIFKRLAYQMIGARQGGNEKEVLDVLDSFTIIDKEK